MASSNPPNPAPQTIDLTDFTPGIFSRLSSVIDQFPAKDGSAQPTQTFNCFALPEGGLAPLPRISFFRTAGDPAIDPLDPDGEPIDPDDYSFPTTPVFPAGYDRIAVLDAHLVSPVEVVSPLNDAVDSSYAAVDLFTARQWFLVETAHPAHVLVIHRFRGHPVYSGNTSNTYAFRDIYSSRYLLPFTLDSTRWKYGWGSISETRTQFDTTSLVDSEDLTQVAANNILATPGSPVVICALGGLIKIGQINSDGDPLSEGMDSGQYLCYPDYHEGDISNPLDPHVVLHDAVYVVPSPLAVANPAIIFGHQGRMVNTTRKSGYNVFKRDFYHGNHDGYRGEEIIDYWPPNGIYNNANGPYRAVYMEEVTAGIGAVHSANANQLILIKHRGGAVQVSGDLDRPQVTRLPGVPSTGGHANKGTMTDKGYAYGTASGVWMWAGSDSATCLSPQLDPLFWLPDDPTIARREIEQSVGSFAYRYPYLYAPNNYVFDFRTGGWFRYYPTPDQIPAVLSDSGVWTAGGATFAFNQASHDGNLWAVVPSYPIDGLFFAEFDQTTGTNFYSWQSQPLNRTRSRTVKAQQVTVVASGVGRVSVTLQGLPLTQPADTIQFDMTKTGIDAITQSAGCEAMDITVTVTSQAHDPALPAPIIHRVSIDFIETQLLSSDALGTQ